MKSRTIEHYELIFVEKDRKQKKELGEIYSVLSRIINYIYSVEKTKKRVYTNNNEDAFFFADSISNPNLAQVKDECIVPQIDEGENVIIDLCFVNADCNQGSDLVDKNTLDTRASDKKDTEGFSVKTHVAIKYNPEIPSCAAIIMESGEGTMSISRLIKYFSSMIASYNSELDPEAEDYGNNAIAYTPDYKIILNENILETIDASSSISKIVLFVEEVDQTVSDMKVHCIGEKYRELQSDINITIKCDDKDFVHTVVNNIKDGTAKYHRARITCKSENGAVIIDTDKTALKHRVNVETDEKNNIKSQSMFDNMNNSFLN